MSIFEYHPPASTKAFSSLQSFIYGCSTCTILSRNSISGFVTYKVNQTPWITPNLNIRRKLIKVIPTYQPNRVLFHKPTDFRFKVVHQAVMQSGLFIIILVVQSERLMCVPIDPFLISGAPRRCIRRTTGDCQLCRRRNGDWTRYNNGPLKSRNHVRTAYTLRPDLKVLFGLQLAIPAQPITEIGLSKNKYFRRPQRDTGVVCKPKTRARFEERTPPLPVNLEI